MVPEQAGHEGIWVTVSRVSLGKESWEKVSDVGVRVCAMLQSLQY